MKQLITLVASIFLLSACSNSSPVGVIDSQSSDASALGGLPNDLAAHPSVELSAGDAFALSPNASAFLEALSRVVEPMRQSLAEQLEADATVSEGLADWSQEGASGQLSVLRRIAAIEGQVMGCQVPPLVEASDVGAQPGVMAFYQPGTTDIGQVVIYPQAIAQGGKYLAVSTLVHEMRHAAQYQLVQADQAGQLGSNSDSHTLALAYADAWNTMSQLGGESNLAYGDYAHLDVEYDAFQTGNEVATLVSNGSYSALGYGFIDAAYSTGDRPQLDLLSLSNQLSGANLVLAVNQAEYRAESQNGGGTPVIQRGRHRGIVLR